MTTATKSDELRTAYVADLRRAARGLPKARREELVAEIAEHLREALPVGADEAETRNALDRLGEPGQIVAEEYRRLDLTPVQGGPVEWIAVGMLLLGGLVIPVLGWVIGAVMLWTSRVWTRREKLVGTLIFPGGLGAMVYLVAFAAAGTAETCSSMSSPGGPTITHCTGGGSTASDVLHIVLAVALLVGPILTAVYLARRIRRPAV
jgi:hypothetical protein